MGMTTNDFQISAKVVPNFDTLNTEFKRVSKVTTLGVNVKIDNKSLKNVNKVVETYSDNVNTAIQRTTILSQEGEVLAQKESKVTEKFKAFNTEVKNTNRNLEETTQKSKSLGQSFGDIVTKVGKFYLATKPIQMLQQAFDEAIATVKEFDDAMVDLRKVSDLDGQALTDYTIKLGELGEAVYRSRTEMTEAAVLFKQTGASDEDAAKLAQLANLYMNVADNEMTAADASAYITSQMKAFQISADNAVEILDKTNEVSNQFAVSSSDISRALTTSSSSLKVYGNDINETMALVTAGAEIMTGKSQQVGRGLRSIGANISALASSAGELELQVKGATKTISLIDEETGDMINTFEALSKINEYWDEMTKSEQAALATTLAGKTQMDVFSSVLSNFNTAIEANTVAILSNGSAWEENNKRADSINAKLNILKSQFQELVLGEGGLQSLGKTLLDVGIAFLKFANTDVGQTTIKISALALGLVAVSSAFSSVTAFLNPAIVAMGTATTMAGKLTAAMTALNISTTALGIGAVVAGVVLLTTAVKALNPSLDDLNKKVEKANEEYSKTTNNIKNINDQLDQIKTAIDSIRSKDKIELTDQKQLETLQKEEASLEQQLLLQEELQRAQRDEATKAGEKVLSKDVYDTGAFGASTEIGDRNTGTVTEALGYYTDKINELQQQLEPLLQQKQALEDANKKESQEYKELRGRIVDLTEQQDSARSAAVDYAKTIEEATENADDSNDKIKEGIDALDGYYDALKNVDGKSQDTSDNIGNLGDKTEESNEDLEESASKAEQLASEWEAWNSSIDSIQSAYDTLSSAVEEYNTQGGYSIDTLQALLALDPAYLSALQEENGQMTLNIDVIKQKIQAEADEAKQLIYKTTIQKLNALASDTASEATTNAGNASANAVDQHNANAQAIGGEAKASMVLAAANSAIGKGASKVDVNKVLREMNQQLKAVDSWVDSVGKNFSRSMGTATKSTNRATNAVNKQSQALQNAKKALQSERDAKVKEIEAELKALEKQYKAEKDAIEKERDDRIDAIEKERDTQIDAIEAEIDAVEKEQKARKEYWDQQLANLEAQNQAVEDGIELQQLYNNLATAQQTKKMIFKDGRFVYSSDEAAVSTAQSAIDEFNRKKEYEKQKAYLESLRDMEDKNYEDRLDDLQSFKEQRTKYYEELLDQLKDYYEESLEQLKNHYEEEKSRLEDYRDQIKESYDKQIDDLENHKNSLNSKYNQMLGNQNAYQNNSLASAQAYVNKYNAIMRGLANGGVTTVSTSEGVKVGGKTSSTTIGEALKGGSARRRSNAKSTGDNYVNGYASGVNGVNDSELSVVGENPKYREIVIGSKLNNDQGTVMALKRGSGVVNAKATNTLASLFNAFTSQRSVGQAISNSDNHATTIEIGSISLPQVTDGKSFISYLQNFKTDLTQRAFKR